MTSKGIEDMSFLKNAKKLLIGGKWVTARSGDEYETRNPANGRLLARIPNADVKDVDDAVTAARRAFVGEWADWKPSERQDLLLRIAQLVERDYDAFARLDTADMGAPISRMLSGKRRVIGLLRYYAGLATDLHGQTISNSVAGDFVSYTLREPVGVVGAILPWNGPFGMAVWKVAPALATGCTVVLKPSEESPLSALLFGELLLEAGLPAGVVNIVTGMGNVGAALASHPGVDKISFTGSTETGRRIVEASASNLKRLSLELGGKSPNIVFADANLEEAAAGAAAAIFSNSGQICSAGSRLFVHSSIYEDFLVRLTAHAKALRVGDGSDPSTAVGPVVSEKQYDRVMGYVKLGVEEGAELACGGSAMRTGALANGWFVEPTVFRDVKDDMRIAREEIFGPVLSTFTFTDADEVIERANDTEFGLGAGVWTKNLDTANYVSRRISTGSVWVNCYQAMDPAVPFGGYRASGYGRESGREHLEEFLNTKAVWMKVGRPL